MGNCFKRNSSPQEGTPLQNATVTYRSTSPRERQRELQHFAGHRSTRDSNQLDTEVRKLDVNTATADQLLMLTQMKGKRELARNIIAHRRQFGCFDDLSDLRSVAGMDDTTYNCLYTQLYIAPPPSYDVSVELVPVQPSAAANDPVASQQRSSVRIATWNLKQFTSQKASKGNIIDVIATIIIKHKLDILALQELGDKNVLSTICEAVNEKDYQRRRWCSCTSDTVGRMFQGMEYNGFLWNSSALQLKQSGLLRVSASDFTRASFISVFKTALGSSEMIFCTIHLKAAGFGNVDLSKLKSEIHLLPALCTAIIQSAQNSGMENIVLVLLGDFNLAPDDEAFEPLVQSGYINTIPPDTFTNIGKSKPDGSHSYDNVWMTQVDYGSLFKGEFGVVREGLKYKERGTSPDAYVSDHCPVWVQVEL